MKFLHIARAVIFERFGHHVQSIRSEVDHGCAGDTDFRDYVSINIGETGAGDGRHTRGEEAGLPERLTVRARIGVRVEGIHTVMLGGNEDDVVDCSIDSQIGYVQWLGVDVAIYWL